MDTLTDDDLLSTTDVCEQAGISYRMLDFWCRVGAIRPHIDARGSGSARRFTRGQARAVRLAATLRDLGASVDRAGDVAHRFEACGDEWAGRIYVDPNGDFSRNPGVTAAGWVVDLDALAATA